MRDGGALLRIQLIEPGVRVLRVGHPVTLSDHPSSVPRAGQNESSVETSRLRIQPVGSSGRA